MLKQSFIFLDKVGLQTERNIWNQGIDNWHDFLEKDDIKGISNKKKAIYNHLIKNSINQLTNQNHEFFDNLLPSTETFRLYNEYKDEVIFLDIETSDYYGYITVIGLFDGYDTKMMVRGYNLDRDTLQTALNNAKLIITFNGKSFDVPVIERFFKIKINTPHIDLRGVCSRIGLTGGLKNIEQQLNISRPDHIRHVYGDDAAYLWHKFQSTGDKKFLDILIEYNEQDIINLKPLADYAIPKLWNKLRN